MPIDIPGAPVPDLAAQTLSGVGRVSWDITGMETIGMRVAGTAEMTCRFIGTDDPTLGFTTPNRPWKAGASLGTNVFAYTGTVKTEYRLVGGRRFLVVECTAYTSGSLTFSPTVNAGTSIVYVGGGVQDVKEEAAIQGQGFNVATSFLTAANGTYGQIVFDNISTNTIAIFRRRRFSSTINGAFGGVSNVTAATFDNLTGTSAPVTLTPANLRTSTTAVPSPSSAMRVRYNVSSTRIDSSPTTANPAGDLLAAYVPFTVETIRIVPPGARFGHFIGGAGGGLSASATVSIFLEWEERAAF